ncbi:zeatin O-glucosyltransferase-like [Humulus lupulus]|uniref:zeatin O-glucosyltransferase-like n=1 Tax=Humulus lupulus TaxID=3486 RepID=UPI002B40EE3A|nr:zeatin O-glucosyltransferase-like [Humulus lupulus]
MATTDHHLKDSSSVVVVMVPLLAQSHLNHLLQLSHVVSSYNIPVHYVGSTLHNSQVKSRSINPLRELTKIHFHNFPLIRTTPFPPNLCSGTKLSETVKLLRDPVAALLRSLSSNVKRLVVVHDVLMTSVVQDFVSLPNAEAYAVNCGSVFSMFTYAFAAIGQYDIIPIKNIPSVESCYTHQFYEFIKREFKQMKSQVGQLHNSCKAIEGSFLEHVANYVLKGEKKIWAVGPLHQTTVFKEARDDDKCLLEWLDKQEPNSVLYISFGTTTTFSEEKIKEIALGLEQSGVKFMWVLRDEDRLDSFSNGYEGELSKLPSGFEERRRGKGMGMVVTKWVSQVEILGHKSIGGFMSHCGWNSCMESISMGVPIAAWPMEFDQPVNALLVTEVLKVGVAVMEWGQRDELVTSSMIDRAVRTLMASEEGGEIRKRAEELGAEVRKSTAEGGVTRMEWDSFIAHITR